MRQIAYETVDVFAEQRFGGNPLAVIADSRGLSPEQMQRIAAEFNYSESTFVEPPANPANTARVRIFTPANEIPFAGHPNVGTAFVLGRMGSIFGKATGDVMRFEEGAGLVEVEVLRRNGEVAGARFRAPRALEVGAEVDAQTVASCVSLDAADVVTERHEPVVASVGLPFAFAQLRSLECLARTMPNAAAFSAAEKRYHTPADRFSLFLYVATGPGKVRARMHAPLSKVLEDPATGSASAALAGLLASLVPNDEPQELTIEQGVEMDRPSVIRTRVESANGRQTVTVAGDCVPVMRGSLTL